MINPNKLFIKNVDIFVFHKITQFHIMQEFVHHLFWDGPVILFGEDKALNWPTCSNIIPIYLRSL